MMKKTDDIVNDTTEVQLETDEAGESKVHDEESFGTPYKKGILAKLKSGIKYSIHTWIFRCFGIAFVLELTLEILGRRSILGGFKFLIGSPIVFFYNTSIIFFTLLFALFLRRRVFGMMTISILWLVCGVVNYVVLGYRVTPFAAIDFVMVKDVISMLDVYYTKFQQVLLVVAGVALVAVLVILYKKTPKFEGKIHLIRTMLLCVVTWGVVIFSTNYNVNHNIISDDFANLGMAYKDYGFAYCFTNSIIDNGIAEPDDYSDEVMQGIKDELDAVSTSGRVKEPNVIFIQLESFFDPNNVEGLELSDNPIPNFTALKEKYPSGYLWVPALGAGTANTEFEVLTGIKSSFFGAGEYPYKTTINEIPVEGLCSIFKEMGYGTYAIHNNKASFYDRQNVYEKMGFDAFISLEYMYNVEYTITGWAKDKTLVDDIMRCLKDTDSSDLVYTISVQGHGRYPEEENTCEDHIQIAYENQEMELPVHYYVNQIYEMDEMIGDLIDALDEYGEDYVLVLYGDHLPTLDLSEEQLDATLYQTEYIMVNNIGLKLSDEDIFSYQLGVKLLEALNVSGGYTKKAHETYEGEELDEKLLLIAYDMLFGDRVLYDGKMAVPENHMRMGVEDIIIESVQNDSGHITVTGDFFNSYSVLYNGDEALDTIYVNRYTLMVNDNVAKSGDCFTVKQVDESKHILSSTAEYIY